jgi:hypothetical protein
MAREKKLSREFTPEEAAEELKGVDESLPEAAAIHRRPLVSGRAVGGAEHRAGAEEEAEEPRYEERPKPTLPPRGVKPSEGKK